jgi:hypothetical protein
MTEHVQAGPRRGRVATAAALLVSIAIAGLTIAGCGGGSSTPTVASLTGHSGRGGPRRAPLTEAQSDRDFIRFAACMRLRGVQMQDPQHIPGHSGLSINLPTRDAATASAYHACDAIIQPILEAKAQAPPEPAAALAKLTNYAQCMRSREISMLDPTADGQLNLGNVPGISSDFGRYSPQFRQADTACRHLLPAGVHDDGTGP